MRDLRPEREPGLLSDLFALLRENRKLWMVPLLLLLVLIGLVVSLGGSPLAPLLYTLF